MTRDTRNHHTDEQKKSQINWNRTATEIAQEMGVTAPTVRRWAQERSKTLNPGKKGRRAVKDWLSVQWTVDGQRRSFDEIAQELGCTKQAVYAAAKKYGIETPKWRLRDE